MLLRAEKAIDIQSTHIATLSAQMEAYQLAAGEKLPKAMNDNGITDETDEISKEAVNAAVAAAKAAEASRMEAEIMMQSLQEQINTLTAELDEEKLESVRKDNEMYDLNRLLREKEALLGWYWEIYDNDKNNHLVIRCVMIILSLCYYIINSYCKVYFLHSIQFENYLYICYTTYYICSTIYYIHHIYILYTYACTNCHICTGEAGELLQEAQAQYLHQKDQNEKLSKEKTDQFNELQTIKTQFTSEIDKLTYDKKEQELKIETLMTENKHLQKEIAEMSGDFDNQQDGKAKERPIVAGSGSIQTPEMSKNGSRINLNNDTTIMTPTTTTANTNINVLSDSTHTLGIALSTSSNSMPSGKNTTTLTSSNATAISRDVLDKEISSELMKLGQRYDLTSNIISDVNELINVYVTSRLNLLLLDYEARIHRDKQIILDYNRKLQDSQSQRTRLENDLSDQLLKYSKLLFDLDVIKGMDGINKTDYFTNRERANSRSLQQRLEQVGYIIR